MTKTTSEHSHSPAKKPEIILHKPTPARGRRAWITEGKNDLGLREREDEPIVIPSPSPGAYTG